MAERRMFAKSIVDSDAFLELPCTAQTLYFHLCIKADDDGFSNTPQKTKRILGASDSDLELLKNGGFIISFDSGVVVIRHWKVHNRVRKDSYKSTLYLKELEMLSVSKEGIYDLIKTEEKTEEKNISVTENGISVTETGFSVTKTPISVTQDRIGEDREVKDSIVEGRIGEGRSPARVQEAEIFPPTFDMVEKYCRERGNKIDAERFYKFYKERGWKIQGQIMADWRSCVKGWEKTEYKRPPPYSETNNKSSSFECGEFFDAALNRSYRNLNIRT